MTTLKSYDLNGKKLSFANWISNLSPQDTPFTSMTRKESINQTMFQWQTDSLAKAGMNSVIEGADADDGYLRSTSVQHNITQILRKVVKVSDTADALANYGRGRELQYQMEKAGSELKRDIEWAFLNNVHSEDNLDGNTPRVTAGYTGLVAPIRAACPDTGAIVHMEDELSEKSIFEMTYNLYLAGSEANVIMYHPSVAHIFSSLQEKDNTRKRIFENTSKLSVYVSVIVDPLGQEYKLIPNRWMPQGVVYFFNPNDFTQMVLRAPTRTRLAKDGSYEKWLIECELGLRLRHPFAAGILCSDRSPSGLLKADANTNKITYTSTSGEVKLADFYDDTERNWNHGPFNASIDKSVDLKVSYTPQTYTPANSAPDDCSLEISVDGKLHSSTAINFGSEEASSTVTISAGDVKSGFISVDIKKGEHHYIHVGALALSVGNVLPV